MIDFVNSVNGYIWSLPLICLCLGVGLYFSLRTRFLQIRHMKEMVRLMFKGKSSQAGISSFQAFALALSGRVGTGNIAGVATAITFGGPGAVFWMWIVAFLGAGSAFVESTLAQIYKEKDDKGQYRGGPAYYIEKGLGMKWYAWIFSFATILVCGLLLPGVQANSIVTSIEIALGIPAAVSAAVVVILLGLIIFGGVKRIAQFTQVVVPFMAFGYILVTLVVVAMNIGKLPDVISLIVSSAFGVHAGFGAIVGLAIEWGVKRGIYSNEAGQGTGAHAAAAAEVSHPVEQGLVQSFSVYVDTLFVCSATAFMIIITGAYNVIGKAGGVMVELLPGVSAGPGYTQAAVESVMPGFGSVFVAIALFFFAFTTLLAYYYIAETNMAYINRKVHRPWLIFALKIMLMASIVYGALKTAEVAWGLGDIGSGLMAWLNIVAIFLLQKPALIALKDYEEQKARGLDPTFDPIKLNIKNADIWVRDKKTSISDRTPR